jgi:DNA-binding response OmpR family regulator
MITMLLVEDDQSLGSTLRSRLAKEQFNVLWAQSCASAAEYFSSEQIDIAIFDVNLPDGDGFTLARNLRSTHKKEIPFIFLTAMNSAEYRLEGYEIGAEEFIPKPFHYKELLLRVQRVAEKYSIGAAIDSGGLVFHPDSYRVELSSGKTVTLQRRDFEILQLLVTNSPRAITREEIMQSAWQDNASANARSVDNSIVRLRSLLGGSGKEVIRSVRGVGYQWDGSEGR